MSIANNGGLGGAIGVAEDISNAWLDCRQVGPIEIRSPTEDGEEVFGERRSLILKELQVVRDRDSDRKPLVHLVFRNRVIEGSPKDSVSAIAITPYAGKASVAKYAGSLNRA